MTIYFVFILHAHSSVKNKKYHDKAVQESEGILLHYCCLKDTANPKTDPSASEYHFSNSHFSSHPHPTTGRTRAHIRLPQNASNEAHKQQLAEIAVVEEPLLPLSISFLSQEHGFGGRKRILLHFSCFATFTQKFLRSLLRSWYEIHLYLSQEYCESQMIQVARPVSRQHKTPTALPAGQSAYIYFPYSPSEIHTYFLTPSCPGWELP